MATVTGLHLLGTTRPIHRRLAVGIEEASAMLSVSSRTLERDISDGRILTIKIRDRRLIPIRELEKLITRS
jgi:excisionase family DNA binding protein